jgi:pantoate--beta-alanine ligase
MRTFDQITSLRAYLRAAREDGKSVGFVPTMGALHEGHLTLMRKARSECDVVVASIFVNPTQFAPGEDFEKYPRDLRKDSVLSQKAGVDALFVPAPDQIYPPGGSTVVEVPDVTRRWEAEVRPDHFRGVATVCAKLFNIVQPGRAYFGQKDYQQLKVIERMVADLHFEIKIVAVPTVREPDGLALSSRNVYLSPEERTAATLLSAALNAARQAYEAGEREPAQLESIMRGVVADAPPVNLEYAAVADIETLEPLPQVDDRAVLLVAARVGQTRLIDNAMLGFTNGQRPDNGGRTNST